MRKSKFSEAQRLAMHDAGQRIEERCRDLAFSRLFCTL
jgi:hypothetical protein